MPCKSWDEACIIRQRDNPPLTEGKLWSLAENYKLARPPTSRRGNPPLPSYPHHYTHIACQVKVCSTSLSESSSTSLSICLPASLPTSTSNVQLLIINYIIGETVDMTGNFLVSWIVVTMRLLSQNSWPNLCLKPLKSLLLISTRLVVCCRCLLCLVINEFE